MFALKRIFTTALLVLLCREVAFADTAPTIVTWKNTSRMMLQISGPIVVDDSANFKVICLDKLPLLRSDGDSVHFKCTLLASDGLEHSTKVHFRSSAGTESFTVTMTAPYLECKVSESATYHSTLGIPYPNPANTEFTVSVESPQPGVSLSFYSLSTGVIETVPVTDGDLFTFSTSELPQGTYYLSLVAGKSVRGVAMVVVAH